MKEHNRMKLALIDARFGKKSALSPSADFEAAFVRLRERILRPIMQDVASELRRLGHDPTIDEDAKLHESERISPCITLHLGLAQRGSKSGYISFGIVVGKEPGEVLAWLVAPPTPFDLGHYAQPDTISEAHVEQLLVDAVEHLFAHSST
ncbi:MAG: hypothetical protein IPM54_09440 [Polyangiaceae bacterium]|nr:hypothetical protein [Polyangiaceae bacterium]